MLYGTLPKKNKKEKSLTKKCYISFFTKLLRWPREPHFENVIYSTKWTCVLQTESGQSPGWHCFAQAWPQSRIRWQGWTHPILLSTQSPAWQILLHVCRPQGSDLPQGLPQEIPSTRQATFFLSSWPPKHWKDEMRFFLLQLVLIR